MWKIKLQGVWGDKPHRKKTPPYNHMGAHKLHKTNFRKSTMEELKTALSYPSFFRRANMRFE